jgi:hypothetical protein
MEKIIDKDRYEILAKEVKTGYSILKIDKDKFVFDAFGYSLVIDSTQKDNFKLLKLAQSVMGFKEGDGIDMVFHLSRINIIELGGDNRFENKVFYTVGGDKYYIYRDLEGFQVLKKPSYLRKKLTANILRQYYIAQFEKYKELREHPIFDMIHTFYI